VIVSYVAHNKSQKESPPTTTTGASTSSFLSIVTQFLSPRNTIISNLWRLSSRRCKKNPPPLMEDTRATLDSLDVAV